MKSKKLLSLALAGVMALALAAPAFAEEIKNSEGTGKTTIPVNISAEATTFNVTLPTAFPTTINPDTGETTASDQVKIVNGSSGTIYVSNITVEAYDGSAETGGRKWTLADYDADLRNGNVDANLVGVMVTPTGGQNATKTGENGGRLATKTGGESEDLLSAASPDWVIGAKDEEDGGRDELGITYLTNATPVSKTFNGQVASIVITVAWYTEDIANPNP